MVKRKDSTRNYLNTTMTDNILARRLIERFEEALEHMKRELVEMTYELVIV